MIICATSTLILFLYVCMQVFITLFVALLIRDERLTSNRWQIGFDAVIVFANCLTPVVAFVFIVIDMTKEDRVNDETTIVEEDKRTNGDHHKGSHLPLQQPTEQVSTYCKSYTECM
jgi:hypothetical protein